MADIMLTCPKCGKQTPVSEYIAEKTAVCHSCGQALAIPKKSKSSGGKLKLRRRTDQSTITTIPTWPTTRAGNGIPVAAIGQSAQSSRLQARELRRVKLNRFLQSLSWLVFIVLTGGLVFIRFFHDSSVIPLAIIQQSGLITIGICYLVIIILAVKDNMFDGLLAIVVPFYPFYYLFFISSAVFLRAIVAALLVAFGFDLVIWLQAIWLQVYSTVNDWMLHV